MDSFSTDQTVQIAESLGAKVFQNKWENNYAKQLNWGLENLPIQTNWVFRLDADEYLDEHLIEEIDQKLPRLEKSISGIIFERKMIFLNTLMNYGMLQMYMLRLFRHRHGFCEERWMDERIVLTQGKSVNFDGYFVDHNLNPLGWWVQKHNNYAIREAVESSELRIPIYSTQVTGSITVRTVGRSRIKKEQKRNTPTCPYSGIHSSILYTSISLVRVRSR